MHRHGMRLNNTSIHLQSFQDNCIALSIFGPGFALYYFANLLTVRSLASTVVVVDVFCIVDCKLKAKV
jgi:hypothetical protein